MGQALADLVAAGVLAVMAGGAGFYARGVVDDYKMRRLLVRINAEVDRAHREQASA